MSDNHTIAFCVFVLVVAIFGSVNACEARYSRERLACIEKGGTPLHMAGDWSCSYSRAAETSPKPE